MKRGLLLPILASAVGGLSLLAAGQDAGPEGAAAREVYLREACWQCHVHARDAGFPSVEGTRRSGPVLGERPFRSPAWLEALLYDPRAVLAESQMPASRGLFEPSPVAEDVAAFVARHDSRGGADDDGIVTGFEYGRAGGDEAGFEDALARLDRSGDGVIGPADAAPEATADLDALVRFVSFPEAADTAAPAPPPVPPRRDARAREEAVARGAPLYARHCAGCHGERGDGNGPVAGFFGAYPPRNFLRGAFRYRSSPVPDPPTGADLFRTIRHGAGPSMPAWPHLSDAQVWDLVEFVRSHHPGYLPRELTVVDRDGGTVLAFRRDADAYDPAGVPLEAGRVVKRAGRWWWYEDGEERPIADGFETAGHRFRVGAPVFDWVEGWAPRIVAVGEPPFPYTAESAAVGARVYAEFGCASCHGPEGRGDGPAAAQTRGGLGQVLRPTDYTRGARWFKGGADPASLVRTFLTGLHGTPMPAYAGNFRAAESAPPADAPWHLAHFVLRQAGVPFEVR